MHDINNKINYNNLLNGFSKVELQETLKYINSFNRLYLTSFNGKEKYKLILNLCVNRVLNFKQLLNYYLENNSVPLCKNCNNQSIYFTNSKLQDCCSSKCQRLYGLTKSKQTNLERYGGHPLQSDIIKTKIKNTNLERYGFEYAIQSKETQNKSKQTNLEKYGVEHVMTLDITKDKIKQTCIERYGVENPYQSEIIKDKIKKNNLEKYGVENPFQSETIKDKIKQTCLKNYGVENPFQSKEIKEKFKLTNLKRYGVEYYNQSTTCKDKCFNLFLEKFNLLLTERNISLISIINESPKIFNLKCNVCNHEFELNYNNQIYICCRKCNPYSRSKLESEIYDYLTLNKIEVISNDRKTILNKQTNCFLELDLYIPSKSLAIEINGIYYHSSKSILEDHLLSSKHLNKYNLCNNQNIQLLQFTDLDFINKPEICYSIINSKLGINQNKIFARKCSIKLVNSLESKEFLNSNHIQGYTPSKINLGLYFENELIQLMTFGHSRFNKKYNFELIRLASKINHQITGGSEKLFKHFKNNYLKSVESIISYCDISKFSGSVYNKLGFKYLNNSQPNYFYWSKFGLESRQKFQKHKLKNLLENFDPKLTEKENMINNGYSIYYDCGNKVFHYINCN